MLGALEGAAAGALRPLPDFASSTSRAMTRPCGPEPLMRPSSMPASLASRRASGDENVRSWPLICAVAAGVGAAAGAAAAGGGALVSGDLVSGDLVSGDLVSAAAAGFAAGASVAGAGFGGDAPAPAPADFTSSPS